MRTAIYICQASCTDFSASADSRNEQEARTIEYIAAHGWEKPDVYDDKNAIPGAENGFEKLTQDGIRRQFDMLVLDSITVYGKSLSSIEDVLVHTFFPAGIHFAIVEDDFCSLGKTIQEVQDYLNQKKVELRARKMHERLFLEQLTGCYSLQDEKYGYVLSKDRKELLIDEAAAAVIREIFQMVLEDLSFTQISDVLNSCEIPSPAVHMAQRRDSVCKAANSSWTDGAIRRIVHCTAYVGYWEKKFGGIFYRIPVAPIITPEVFAKAQEKCRSCGRKSGNNGVKHSIFSKRIFDAKTGKPLFQRNFSSGDIAFVANAQVNCLPKNRRKYILYEDVADAVLKAISEEIQMAGQVVQHLNAGEGAFFLQEQLKEDSVRAEEIFAEMAALSRERILLYQSFHAGGITESEYEEQLEELRGKLFVYEAEMTAITKDAERKRSAYSLKNEWIRLFADASLPEELQADDVKRWVTRVEVNDFETVQVILEKAEWKALLPEKWLHLS